ncbi:hypothetical protein OpiT1DRAFT_02173 [Opitutaceae bacterium TAV1]|nr:hypothetical protein OpiT1DRAFT_02173 [Opitutaceae bacterium TAV1]
MSYSAVRQVRPSIQTALADATVIAGLHPEQGENRLIFNQVYFLLDY